MDAQPKHLLYDLRYALFSINNAVSTSQIVVAITWKVAFILFTTKNVNASAGDDAYTYNKSTNFDILDAISKKVSSWQIISEALH